MTVSSQGKNPLALGDLESMYLLPSFEFLCMVGGSLGLSLSLCNMESLELWFFKEDRFIHAFHQIMTD